MAKSKVAGCGSGTVKGYQNGCRCKRCKESNREKSRKWRATEKGQISKAITNRKYKFNISDKDYQEMLSAQGGVCAICQNQPKKKSLAVDHCHDTGKVRGLLCGKCNRGLGHFKDNPLLTVTALKYLLENS